MLLNSQIVIFSEGISTILQKGKVVSNPVQIPRLIQTLTPIILGLGRIPIVLNGLICLLKGAKEWILNYQVTSEDIYLTLSHDNRSHSFYV